MASETLTSGAYIKHHLQTMTFGLHPDGRWGLAHTDAEAKEMGFWTFNIDPLGSSIALGVFLLLCCMCV